MAVNRFYSSTAIDTTLTAPMSPTDLTATVTAISGYPASYPYTIVIDEGNSNEEILQVTNVSGTSFTVQRGVDGTTAQSHSVGASVKHAATARDYREPQEHIAASTGVHGVTGAVVGTTDVQTVSGKTFTSVKSLGLDTVAPGTAAVGTFAWNATYGTAEFQLKGGNVTLQVGQEAVARVVNGTASTILEGQVVYLSGASGNLPTVALASAATEAMSTRTIGVATENIAAGQAGYVTLIGMVHGLNTSAYTDGQVLWLSTTPGAFTATRPTAPNHGVLVGIVVRAHASVGQIYVTVVNGQELDELHDVLITSPADKQFLRHDAASGVWKNSTVSPTVTLTGDVTGSATMTNLDSTSLNVAIASGVIVNADVSPTAAIAKTKLDLNAAITSADLVDGTITNTDISPSAGIALSKLAVDPLARANHTGTQAASTISDFNTAVRTNRLDQMAVPTAAVSMNGQKVTNVADPTSLQDAVTLNYLANQKGAVNGIASLDSGGKIPSAQLPALAISETFVVASQAAMLALSAQVGDIAVRTDLNKSFILRVEPASTLSNWQELLTPTDSVLSVDGQTGAVSLSGSYVAKSGDTMTGPLTLPGNPTLALQAAPKQYVDAVAGSADAAAASAAAAAASYDSFDDRYLGPKATDPTVDNDGNPLLTGALYWNTAVPEMRVYDGAAWKQLAPQATFFRWRKVAAGGETTLSGADDLGISLSYNPGAMYLYLNGTMLVKGVDYTATTGSTVNSLAALSAGDVVEIISLPALVIADAIMQTVVDAKGDLLVGSSADTIGRLPVGADGTVLMADSSQPLGLKYGTVDLTSIEIMSIMGAF